MSEPDLRLWSIFSLKGFEKKTINYFTNKMKVHKLMKRVQVSTVHKGLSQ